MATLISGSNIRPLNFSIIIDQQFDLDEVLTLAEMPIQYDRHHDHDHITTVSEAAQNPNSIVDSLPLTVITSTIDVDSCAVCMESFRSEERGERVPCGHVYHAGCITAWLSICNSCPLCRCRISGADQFSSASKQ